MNILIFLSHIYSLYEIDLGKIKSFPKLNINLHEEKLKILKENKDYEYDVSIIGRKINLKDENLNLNNYGKTI